MTTDDQSSKSSAAVTGLFITGIVAVAVGRVIEERGENTESVHGESEDDSERTGGAPIPIE